MKNIRSYCQLANSTFKTKAIKTLFNKKINENDVVLIKGWIQSVRQLKAISFFEINDGSCSNNVQVVIKNNLLKQSELTYGSSVVVEGSLKSCTDKRTQDFEIKANNIKIIGECNNDTYPFKTKQNHEVEYTRQFPHLRSKHVDFARTLRLRSMVSHNLRSIMNEDHFTEVHTPIITSNDCEGAGELFQVEPSSQFGDKCQHFFDVPAFLTVSGQLHLEASIGGVGNVYTLGPTFRAENSRGRHHLSEFYMLEAEMPFLEKTQHLCQTIEGILKKCTQRLLESSSDDVIHVTQQSDKHLKMLENIVNKPFICISYTEAIQILEKQSSKCQFQFPTKWGEDLSKEHEKFLVKYFCNQPVFVVDYPKDLKPFYMKCNDDGETVAAVDLLGSGVGEICGGSLRETDIDVLTSRLGEHLSHNYKWYMDLRRYGSTPHGGFGLGFERFLQFLLQVDNIKDVIPFPRSTHNCKL